MKRLMKSMVLMAAAALALASCAKENVNEPNNGTQKFAEVSFKAEIPAYQTTKSTIDVDGLTFNTRWAEGDQMGMSYSYGETGSKTEKENVPAKYSKDGSYAVILPTEYTGRWDYYVYYPYQSTITSSKYVEIPFGSERTQSGNAINSAYDIMHGLHGTKNAAAGKEEDGSSIHFDMYRLTSLLHFHFTSSLNEKVLKATLSVDGDPIAADNITLYVDMVNNQTTYASTNRYNSITMNLTDVTANDFSLWFNILPYDGKDSREDGIENIKLVVETETKTFSITNPNTDVDIYEASQIHSITANVPDSAWKNKTTPEENKVFFYESFDGNNGTGGNDNTWNNIAGGTSSPSYDNNGWDAKNGYAANKCVRFGAGNKAGSITSPALGITSNSAKISFKAAAWDGSSENTKLNVSISGSGSIDTESVTLVKGAWKEYTCTISGADKDTKVTFEASTAKNNRFFLDEVYVYTGEKPSKPVTPTLTLSKESASVEASETTTSFDVQSNTDWTVTTDADWIKVYDKDGKENGTVTIQFDANKAATARTATFTVKTADNAISKTFTLTQKAFGAETKVTYDFTKIDGFADWSTGYSEHAVNYTESIVTFKSANRNTSTIKDQPVTKGDDVSVVMTGTKTIKSVKFVCKQWGNKTQTITLNTSTDGGKNYTATSTKSSNFTLEATNLSAGINAVKFTFTSQSNQVGISSLEITYAE